MNQPLKNGQAEVKDIYYQRQLNELQLKLIRPESDVTPLDRSYLIETIGTFATVFKKDHIPLKSLAKRINASAAQIQVSLEAIIKDGEINGYIDDNNSSNSENFILILDRETYDLLRSYTREKVKKQSVSLREMLLERDSDEEDDMLSLSLREALKILREEDED